MAEKAGHRPDLVRRPARGEHADLLHAPPFGFAFLSAFGGAGLDQDHRHLLGRHPFVLHQIIAVALIIIFPGSSVTATTPSGKRHAWSARRRPAPADLDSLMRQNGGGSGAAKPADSNSDLLKQLQGGSSGDGKPAEGKGSGRPQRRPPQTVAGQK